MTRKPAHPDPDSALSCEQARGRTHDFALGELGPLEVRELRQHILECRPCRDAYKEAIETTAALAHVSKEGREQEEAERFKRRVHAERFGPTREIVKHRRYYRLRIALIPAFFIILMINMTGLGEPPARVDIVHTEGTVKLAKQQVVILGDPLLVLPGRWVHTKASSSASLESLSVRVEVGARTDVLLESARPVRMRLRGGLLDVDGDLVIYSVLGILNVTQGKGRVTLDNDGLLIEVESGEWKLLDRSGENLLAPGQPHLVAAPVLAAK